MDDRLDETIGDLRKFAGSLEETAKKFDELRGSMAALAVTATSSDGRVRVTVDSNGVPTAIDLAVATRGMEPAALSTEIMACLHRAQAQLRSRVTDLVHDVVGEDSPASDMVGRYAERFPDPASMDGAISAEMPPSQPPANVPPPASEPTTPPSAAADSASPLSRKPNRDRVVIPDEPDDDDEYFNRKSWLV